MDGKGRKNLEQFSAEECFSKAHQYQREGNDTLATQWMQVGRAKSSLKRAGGLQASQPEDPQAKLQDSDALFVDALEDVGARSPAQPKDEVPRKPHIVKTVAALALLLVATAAGLYAFGAFSQGPDYAEVSATEFMEVSDVVERVTTGTASTDLILHVNADWDAVSDKEALLKQWATQAGEQGYSVVNVMGPDGQRVAGSRNNGQTARIY